MLGRRTQCARVELDQGLAQSICAWTTFLSTYMDQRMVMLNNIRGGKRIYFVIQVTFSNISMQFGHSTYQWISLFTPSDVLIGTKAYVVEEAFMTFDVHDDGRLTFTRTETYLFSFCLH